MKKAPKRYGYQGGGKVGGDPKKKTPEEWRKEHSDPKYAEVPYLKSQRGESEYPTYYDTTKFKIDVDPNNPYGDRTITNLSTNAPYSFNTLSEEDVFSYAPPRQRDAYIAPQRPAVTPTSTRTFLQNDDKGNTTYRDNATGEVYVLDKQGNKVEPLSRAEGGSVYKMKRPPKRMGGKIC